MSTYAHYNALLEKSLAVVEALGDVDINGSRRAMERLSNALQDLTRTLVQHQADAVISAAGGKDWS